MNTSRFWNWRTALIAAAAAPISVLLHEFAHIGALELGGVDAKLRGFSMGMPVGYFWNFAGLEEAMAHYNVSSAVFVVAALAGPITTLALGYGGLLDIFVGNNNRSTQPEKAKGPPAAAHGWEG